MLNGLDLFSGIGGISLALSDWVCSVAYCESDLYAQSVLLSRMERVQLPAAPIWDDVRTLCREVIRADIDIIYGGFPCQDISVAGDGQGLAGKRSGLVSEIFRLVGDIRPLYSSKMCRLLELEEPNSLSKLWPAKGMTAGGMLYQLPRSERHTSEKDGSSLLPTPTASRYGTSNNGCPGDGRKVYKLKGKASLWGLAKQNGGKLNPIYIEWMMGYPRHWSDLEPWATQWYRSKLGRPSKD